LGDEARGPDGAPRSWEIEFYKDDDGRQPVLDWIKDELTPTKRRALGTAMRRVLQVQGPAVQRNNWGDKVADGIFEFRLRMNGKGVINLEAEIRGITEDEARERLGLNPSEDILLRVFCTSRHGKVVLLLHGYDKGGDVSKKRQQNEIAEAKARLNVLKARDALARKEARRKGTP
jgi:hypothetical protein